MNSTYGVVKPSLIDPSQDVQIFYHYRPTRSSEDTAFKSFREITEVSSVLSNSQLDTDVNSMYY